MGYPIAPFIKKETARISRDGTLYIGNVTHYDLEHSCNMMTTPNEKFRGAMEALCGVLGITQIETYARQVRNGITIYYRVKGSSKPHFYTAGDFVVVLSSMVSARLVNGETLQK